MSTTATTTKKISTFDRLYTGVGGVDFIGRSKLWYAATVVLLLISIGSMLFRGFDLNIDFEGGTKLSMQAGDLVAEQVEETFVDATGVTPELTQIVGSGDSRTLELQSEHLSQEQIDAAREAIFVEHQPLDSAGDPSPDAIGDTTVSESWGSTITERMLLALVVFLIAAALYVALRLEREMAVAAMAGLAIDGIVIGGIYSLFGLEVSPAVIIGLLTVLTFSIYDTVIVFDKVKENTTGILDSRRSTYGEQANLAVNQTVMRSLSTSVISALPIIALLVVAVWLMGVGTLRDLALIQLIGVLVGIFSSLFLATPLLVTIVNRRKDIRRHNQQVAEYRAAKTGQSATEESAAQAGEEDEGVGKRTVSAPRATQPTAPAQSPLPPRSTGSTWRPNQR
ncbi:protein translocase subunit SecF [Corynebacterium guangdongense]|uniref:Protein-export membrane protein SecF n=1 Tax=Corynebacterium guangdongense TaxID=1783348 RepID=A0ABU1ZWZ7_9CORY|nr:protein translocase subunit SecF [Corynebacterium guangdongense]MDR7329459.1 preprotein translocase subunit SecF [Corynebacterium guangdongense]WJZ18024.1 preprotein translocase subunit SecF [Corynebacterium guangdongense]